MAKVKYTKAQRARIRRRRFRQLIGAGFLLLALDGVFSIVSFVIGKVRTRKDDGELKLEYAKLIAPLVALDPVPFESVDKAKPEILEEASIWSIIYNEDTTKYQRNENDQMMIPAVDVDRHFKKLFGSASLPEHVTFSDGDLTFEYNEETESYLLPITGLPSSYFPRVAAIDSSGSTRTLTVEYVTYADQTGIAIVLPGDDSGYQVVKKMEYILLKEGGEYHIYSVKYASAQ